MNNIPKSKTRSELMRTIKATNIPHHSFDIDGDGYVSQEDLLLGKRFDLDGNGVLDPDEQEVGRRIIAEEGAPQVYRGLLPKAIRLGVGQTVGLMVFQALLPEGHAES